MEGLEGRFWMPVYERWGARGGAPSFRQIPLSRRRYHALPLISLPTAPRIQTCALITFTVFRPCAGWEPSPRKEAQGGSARRSPGPSSPLRGWARFRRRWGARRRITRELQTPSDPSNSLKSALTDGASCGKMVAKSALMMIQRDGGEAIAATFCEGVVTRRCTL